MSDPVAAPTSAAAKPPRRWIGIAPNPRSSTGTGLLASLSSHPKSQQLLVESLLADLVSV